MSTAISAPDLPDGWHLLSIGELGDWAGGGTPSKKNASYWENGTIPWVSPKDMKSLTIDQSQDSITAAALAESNLKLIPAGSIAFVVRSGILEHTLPVSLLGVDATVNQDLKALTPFDEVDPLWLLFALRGIAEDIRRACSKDGVTVASIEFPLLQAYPIAVPPKDVQEQLVCRVEELLGQLDEGASELDAGSVGLTQFWEASLQTAFAPRPGWRDTTLGDVARTSSGGTPSRGRSEFFGPGVPWLKIGDLNEGLVVKAEESITQAGLDSSSARVLHPGVVLLAMYGASIGRLGILGTKAATNQAICAFQADPEVVLTDFLFYFLKANRRRLVGAGWGGAQPNISQTYLKAFPISLPSLDEQADLVAVLRETERLVSEVRGDLDAAGRLRGNLLTGIFRAVSAGTSLLEGAP